MALYVELVSPERELWAGEAEMVVATTADGDIGIMPRHSPVLGTLVEGGVVRVLGPGQEPRLAAAVHGGFISIAHDRVSILAENAELGPEVDVDEARSTLDRALAEVGESEEAAVEAARARARLRAAGQEV